MLWRWEVDETDSGLWPTVFAALNLRVLDAVTTTELPYLRVYKPHLDF
jgi:hypothetical protein